MPDSWMACSSNARTWATEYNAVDWAIGSLYWRLTMSRTVDSATDLQLARERLEIAGRELGFAAIGIAGIELDEDEQLLNRWLAAGHHGEMHYMARHGRRRSRPAELLPGTLRVISARMDYWPSHARDAVDTLGDDSAAYISRYALGRDYHKVMRRALQRLAGWPNW
jgi:epoxyqueuosine reductase